jgi:5S rRNA maturation endonuclease (ribonuclease M5)
MKIERKVLPVFGRFNYDSEKDMYKHEKGWITGNMAKEVGIILTDYDEAGKILKGTLTHHKSSKES